MSKRETTSEGFTLEELLDFMKVPELKDIARLLGFRFKNNPTKNIIVAHIAKMLRDDPMRLIKACYIYELEMFRDIIEGKMTPEYAEKSGILFDFNRFGLVYSLVNKKTKLETLHFPKELGEILLPLIESEIGHRKIIGGDLVEKAVIGCTNIYGYTDLYNVFDIVEKVEERLDRKFEEETFNDVISPFYHQTLTKKDNTNPILSPFASMVGFYPDEDHLTDEEPKEYDLDTLLRFGEMPYPDIPIKETEALEKVLQKHGNHSEGTPKEMIRQLWLDKQDQSKWNRMPEFGKYFLFTDERDIDKSLMAVFEFYNNVPCWRFNGNTSRDIMRKERNQSGNKGKMPKISMGPNMRKMGEDSLDLTQIMELAQKYADDPESFEMPTSSSAKSQSKPTSSYQTVYESNGLPITNNKKVGRNEPCPCGSGKKYKNCCGK